MDGDAGGVGTTDAGLAERVRRIRAFTRFYTAEVGALDEGLEGTTHSLAEARVIYEVAQHAEVEVVDLRRDLELDSGYLSRILQRLEGDGLVERGRSPADARRQVVRLTAAGQDAYEALDGRTARRWTERIGRLGQGDQHRLVAAMDEVEAILGPDRPATGYLLRPPGPGDLGWIVHRHGAVYPAEYGWDERFEALVARVVADYAAHHEPEREACWIAELDGQPVGCVFCIERDEATAQLRLLLVDPAGRGLGIGQRLVEECIAFARKAGYTDLVLWTNEPLRAARTIYDRLGFSEVDAEPHTMFGPEVLGQTLTLAL